MNTSLSSLFTAADLSRFSAALADLYSDPEECAAIVAKLSSLTDGVSLANHPKSWETNTLCGEIPRDDLDAIALETLSDDGENTLYRLADGVWLHDHGYGQCVSAAPTAAELLKYWNYDLPNTYEDTLVSFGIAPEITAAATEDAGPFRVWITKNYHASTCNAPRDSWAKDEGDNDPLTFETYPEAAAWVGENEPTGTYYLSHGEYARPEFTITTDF